MAKFIDFCLETYFPVKVCGRLSIDSCKAPFCAEFLCTGTMLSMSLHVLSVFS